MEENILEMFMKDKDGNMTLQDLANTIGVTIEELEEMTLEEISKFSIEVTDKKVERVQSRLEYREQVLNAIGKEYGVDREVLEGSTRMYFSDLKNGK